MKLTVYSMTPVWVASIFYIIPVLRFIPWLAGLYRLYVLYLGFNNPLMDTPRDKVLGYMLVSLSVITVLSLVFVLLLGVISKAVGIRPKILLGAFPARPEGFTRVYIVSV